MRFGRAVHTKGLGSALVSATKRLMAASRSATDRNTPRLRRRFVSLAKKPSTALSQEAEGGGEVKDEAGVTGEPGEHLGVLVGGVVVEDGVDHLSGRDLRLDGIEEAVEFPGAGGVACSDR